MNLDTCDYLPFDALTVTYILLFVYGSDCLVIFCEIERKTIDYNFMLINIYITLFPYK